MAEKRVIAYSSMSLLDFQARFADEQACYEYLAKTRFPGGFQCPRCKEIGAGVIRRRGLWQCKGCRMQTSVTAGTMFHRTRTPLNIWFWAIFLVAGDKRGHSALQLSKEMSIQYDRAWLMIHKIRAAMAHRNKLYQLRHKAEIDEAYFGAPVPGKRGRGTKRAKALVAVGITEYDKPGYARIQLVKRLDRRCVNAFAKSSVAPGSTIRTDGLNVYGGLDKHGFRHEPIVASGQPKEKLLKWVHIIIANAKAFIQGTFHGLDPKYMQRYLDEFCYRFNRRYRDAELFDRLLFACASAPPMIYDELTR